jgi:hypothetical protein
MFLALVVDDAGAQWLVMGAWDLPEPVPRAVLADMLRASSRWCEDQAEELDRAA